MELTMKRERLGCCERVFEYCAPAEEAVETVVPDTMPDVERVLCAEGTAILRSKEVQEGRVSVTAGVAATVLAYEAVKKNNFLPRGIPPQKS